MDGDEISEVVLEFAADKSKPIGFEVLHDFDKFIQTAMYVLLK